MNIKDYNKLIKENICRFCGYEGLKHLKIHSYDHDGGWSVQGYDRKQWLYVTCPKCCFDWALWKLGVSRE